MFRKGMSMSSTAFLTSWFVFLFLIMFPWPVSKKDYICFHVSSHCICSRIALYIVTCIIYVHIVLANTRIVLENSNVLHSLCNN